MIFRSPFFWWRSQLSLGPASALWKRIWERRNTFGFPEALAHPFQRVHLCGVHRLSQARNHWPRHPEHPLWAGGLGMVPPQCPLPGRGTGLHQHFTVRILTSLKPPLRPKSSSMMGQLDYDMPPSLVHPSYQHSPVQPMQAGTHLEGVKKQTSRNGSPFSHFK